MLIGPHTGLVKKIKDAEKKSWKRKMVDPVISMMAKTRGYKKAKVAQFGEGFRRRRRRRGKKSKRNGIKKQRKGKEGKGRRRKVKTRKVRKNRRRRKRRVSSRV